MEDKTLNGVEITPPSQEEQYVEYLKMAYAWYHELKAKEGKTPSDISYIITVEESFKRAIVEQYQLHIINQLNY